MKKTLQRQLLEMLQTLEDGIRYIGREGNPVMLQECIIAIKAIRETCQQSLVARHQAAYVDLFDGMAQALQQLPDRADQATLQQTTDLCQELIEYARQALQRELTRKKIMVFLPYKASMWDSLESVWKAAYEDKEHCETYVIPIPYCDRNPDMTAKEWHCEAGLFPDYVPVLDWRDYSRDKLREMHPDVIFIHNPYDNFNAVTSVDMQYYSRNLKGIAAKLVYIPYFVMGDAISPHFCQTQGVINADYVIVQDENIKEQYERYYPGGNPPKGKILALGSPKFDKVCNTTKDDYTLPAEWKHLIGNKKVILYNTSLTAMLEHTDKFNTKLRYVFDTFKQRDDVVLWWRPHPLLRATIDSMAPELRDKYRQIEQKYISEGWGIYDDTPDMNRAIACTDAYYGDASSLVWLYQKTGKRILLQNMFVDTNWIPYFSFNDMLVDGNDSWFIYRHTNIVYHLDLVTDKVEYVCNPAEYCIGEENECGVSSFMVLCRLGNMLWLFPYRDTHGILQYDMLKRRFLGYKKIQIPQGLRFFSKESAYDFDAPLFVKVVQYRNYIFAISDKGFILRYDICTGGFIYLTQWVVDIIDIIGDSVDYNQNLLGTSICLVDNKLLLPIVQGNIVAEFDLISNEYKIHKIGSLKNRYSGITFDGRSYWLLDVSEGKLIKWNRSNMEIQEMFIYGKPIENYIKCMARIIYYHGEVIVVPGLKKLSVIRIDTNTLNVCFKGEKEYAVEITCDGLKYDLALQVNNDRIFVFCAGERCLIELNDKVGMRKNHILQWVPYKGLGACIYEHELDNGLMELMDYIIGESYKIKSDTVASGKTIYNFFYGISN